MRGELSMEKKKFIIETADPLIEKHIIITSIACIVFAYYQIIAGCSVLLKGDESMNGYLYAVIVQLICAIWFIFRKNPICGAVCTGVFIFTRTSVFTGQVWMFAVVVVLAITAYFAYATYLSLRDWLERIGYFDLEENKSE